MKIYSKLNCFKTDDPGAKGSPTENTTLISVQNEPIYSVLSQFHQTPRMGRVLELIW